jgi:hypothetical protein
MGIKNRFLHGYADGFPAPVCPNVSFEALKPAGATNEALYGETPLALGRILLMGVRAQGILGAAGRIGVQMRLAPMKTTETEGVPFGVGGADEDHKLVTAYKDWTTVAEFNKSAAGEFDSTIIFPAGNISLASRVSDGTTPVLRVVDLDAAGASQALTFVGVPADGETVTFNGKVATFRTTPALADEVKRGADAAECAANYAAWFNHGPGEGDLYFSSTAVHGVAGAYAQVAAGVVTCYAYPWGVAPNSWGTTETAATACSWGGATMSGGTAGALSSATTDYLEALIEFMHMEDPADVASKYPMPAPLDPRTLIAYPFDETGSNDTRKSIALAAHDLLPKVASGSDGVPVVPDGRGGWALDTRDLIAGLASTRRWVDALALAAAWNVHPLFLGVPLTLNSTGYAYGCRLQYRAAVKAGDTRLWGMAAGATSGEGHWGLLVDDDGGGTPKARIKVVTSQRVIEEPISSGSWTDTDSLGSLGSYYLEDGEWWRAVVRLYNVGANSYQQQLILYREKTGKRYRLTRNASSSDYAATTTVTHLAAGSSQSGSSSFQGYIDDAFLLNGDLSEAEAIDLSRDGTKIPREPDDTHIAAPHFCLSAVLSDENAAAAGSGVERETRRHIIKTGRVLARVPVRKSAESMGVRIQGFAAGRPVAPNVLSVYYIQKAGARRTVRP